MKLLYLIYQICVSPLLLLITILDAVVTIVGGFWGDAAFWGYWPSKVWSQLMCYILLLPVKVERSPRVGRSTSYVFVANHQGAFDIWLIYGFLGHPFKWIMKHSLRRIPLVGKAIDSAGHIFMDRQNPNSIRQAIATAQEKLRGGASIVVFPEGTRSNDGELHKFKRGAFVLADELQLPVVPVSIIGSYEVMNKHAWHVTWHRMRMVIHDPIMPQGQGPDNLKALTDTSFGVIEKELRRIKV
ncbi:MAG: lysophospholipid acyltransferase family protein [Bacteroidales bacterium]|nr:lysophospholipid acyltransferase family protein [Bacteroidales bacterium]